MVNIVLLYMALSMPTFKKSFKGFDLRLEVGSGWGGYDLLEVRGPPCQGAADPYGAAERSASPASLRAVQRYGSGRGMACPENIYGWI